MRLIESVLQNTITKKLSWKLIWEEGELEELAKDIKEFYPEDQKTCLFSYYLWHMNLFISTRNGEIEEQEKSRNTIQWLEQLLDKFATTDYLLQKLANKAAQKESLDCYSDNAVTEILTLYFLELRGM